MEKAKKKEDLEGTLTGAPNPQWEKFFEKFKEIETLEESKWKPLHLLSYFTKKYEEKYKAKYQFKFNSELPLKSFEVFQIKKLSNMLSSNPEILKEYIDWVYATKVEKAKRKLTSISFMTAEGIVNEYKLNFLLGSKKNNIDRSTKLPSRYSVVFEEVGTKIETYGDLAFLSQMSNMPIDLVNAMRKIEELGFDLEALTRIV